MFTTLPDLLAHPRHLIATVLSGSRAYGTANADSDEDLKGLFALPAKAYLAISPPPPQLADARGDVVYYSLRRALELLGQGNPNLLELVYAPTDCVRLETRVFARLRERRNLFLSKSLVRGHVGYALGQIRKARGQHKWINQPQPQAPPQREEFCWVITAAALAAGADPLQLRPVPLAQTGIDLQQHHASHLPHAREAWRLYHFGEAADGVFSGGRILHRSISLEDERARFAGLLFFHEQAFDQARTEHQNYWTWRRERNESRWRQQESGELDFDAKNLMHTVRLLHSGLQILEAGEPRVRFEGQDLQTLLDIRNGRWTYERILEYAESMRLRCDSLLATSALPEHCAMAQVETLLEELTELWESQQ